MMSTTTTQSGVTGTGEWDSRLNRLLEDLQETVIPTDPTSRNAQEYREYHITKRTQINDEPPQTMDEKWVEIGNLVGGGPVGVSGGGVTPSSKSVAFADEYDFKNNYASSSTKQSSSRTLTSTDHHTHQRGSNMEFLAPANMTTELKSGPTSPSSSSSPKIERKEFYTKASYTTMIKGEEPPSFPPITSPSLLSQTTTKHLDYNNESSSSYNKSSYMSSTTTDTNNRHQETHNNIGSPLYTSTPMKQPQSPPPHKADALKTPPMIRKILQQSSTQKDHHHHHHHTHSNNMGTTTTQITKPPTGGVPLPIIQSSSSSSSTHQMISTKTASSSSQPKPIPSYDEPPERIGAKYYTSTVTTEHTRRGEREVSPIRRFPVQQQQPPVEANPKRLDELLASFEDSSYMRSSTTTTRTDGDGPHRSVPYGPGTTQVRSVRIHEDEVSSNRRSADESSELLRKRNNTTVQNPTYNKDEVLMKNVAGPPVFYPPGNIFNNSQNGKGDEGGDSSVVGGKRKEKEKMKGKRSEKGGEGAVPVPVCLPVCCAAPCSIM